MSGGAFADTRNKLIILLLCVLLLEALCLHSLGQFELIDGSSVLSSVIPYRPNREVLSPILLLGTDADGLRTDVMILAGIRSDGSAPLLLSLPRDTLIQTEYGVDKLNAVYAVHGGGENGIAALNGVLKEQLCIEPKRYILVDLAAFELMVDEVGGIWFDVPTEMHYADPTQNLQIDLVAGYQKLDGAQALGLVRYRNYFFGDIDRTKMQQSLMKASAKQILGSLTPKQLLLFCTILKQNVRTNLDLSEIVNLALAASKCDFDQTVCRTLPGDGKIIGGIDYYCLDENESKAIIAEMFQ